LGITFHAPGSVGECEGMNPHILKWTSTLGIRVPMDFQIFKGQMTHSQLLARLKSESKYKTAEGGGIGARSLVHNTLRGRRACWNSTMGLGRVDKLHSLTRACTQPTQGG
jgi:hypothetical protein